jgi:hypothetical protein
MGVTFYTTTTQLNDTESRFEELVVALMVRELPFLYSWLIKFLAVQYRQLSIFAAPTIPETSHPPK